MMRMQTEGEAPMEVNALLPQQPVACGGFCRGGVFHRTRRGS